MKYLLIILLISSSYAQQSKVNGTSKIKKQIERHYTTTYQQKKDELSRHIEIGFDIAGNQTYFIDHLAVKMDTIQEFSKTERKKIGRKTYYYNEHGKLLICRQKKKNLIMLFFPPDMEKPASYELYDKKGMIGGIFQTNYKNHPYKKAFITERKFDEKGNPVYYVGTEYYLPEGFDPENKRARKISRKGLVQAENSIIVEYEYEFF